MGQSTRIQTTQEEITQMNEENQTEVTTEQTGEAPQSVDLSIKPKEAMPEETPQEPILGKFKTQEDLIAAYQALEQKMSQPATEEKPVEEAPTKTPNEEFSLDKYANEYFSTGELSPESYMELGKEGYSKQVVDTYIQGQKVVQERAMSKMMDIAGGQENYTAAVQWASENWTEAQINTYNTALTQGEDMAAMAIRDLVSQAGAQQSSKPSLLDTNPAGSLAGGRYESSEEWIRDLKNPLYKSDPAFRAKVDAKLANSPGI